MIRGKGEIPVFWIIKRPVVDFLKPWKKRIMFGLCLSVFCVALDNTIIATAIPRITDDFRALQDVGWYGSAYLLTTCAFQLFYGKLYSRFSIKLVFLAALFIFEAGSLICGNAPNSIALIIGVVPPPQALEHSR